MQSTLKDYPGAASDRERKLHRAIGSVINQTFQDWELIVVSDNCQRTIDISAGYISQKVRLLGILEDHAKWSAKCRNAGIDFSNGQYILYLDNDDYFDATYLQELYNAIQQNESLCYIVDHYERHINAWKLTRGHVAMNAAGTANIVHSSKLKSRWPDECRYGSEDWTFIKRIIAEAKHYKHLDVAGYFICHIRNKYDI